MRSPATLFEKIWSSHRIAENAQGETLLFVDRHLIEDSCFICFEDLARLGRPVRRPDLTFAMTDHTVPTRNRAAGSSDPEILNALKLRDHYVNAAGIALIGADDPRQGITHVVAPELGLTLPGLVLACDDSHTTTHGAFGTLAFGV